MTLTDYGAPVRRLLYTATELRASSEWSLAYTLKTDHLSFLHRHAGSVRQRHMQVYIQLDSAGCFRVCKKWTGRSFWRETQTAVFKVFILISHIYIYIKHINFFFSSGPGAA